MPIGSRVYGNGKRARAASLRQTNNKFMCGPQSAGVGRSVSVSNKIKSRTVPYKLGENLYFLEGAKDTVFKFVKTDTLPFYVPTQVGPTGEAWNNKFPSVELAVKDQPYVLGPEFVDPRFDGNIVRHKIGGLPHAYDIFNLYIADRKYLMENMNYVHSELTDALGEPFNKDVMLKNLYGICEGKVMFIWN